MHETPARFVAHLDVVCTKLGDDEAVLLNMATQRYYTLNETGVIIWGLLAKPRTAADIASAITESYEVDHADALAFAEAFLADLVTDDLVLKR